MRRQTIRSCVLALVLAIFLCFSASSDYNAKILEMAVSADTALAFVQCDGEPSDVQATAGRFICSELSWSYLGETALPVQTLIVVENGAYVSDTHKSQVLNTIHDLIEGRAWNESISIATVNDQMTVLQDYTQDAEALDVALKSIQYDAQDAHVPDVIYSYIETHADNNTRAYARVILFSTGRGGESAQSRWTAVQNLLTAHPYPMTIIGLTDSAGSLAADRDTMLYVTELAGSTVYYLDNISSDTLKTALQTDKILAVEAKVPEEGLDGSACTFAVSITTEAGTARGYVDNIRFFVGTSEIQPLGTASAPQGPPSDQAPPDGAAPDTASDTPSDTATDTTAAETASDETAEATTDESTESTETDSDTTDDADTDADADTDDTEDTETSDDSSGLSMTSIIVIVAVAVVAAVVVITLLLKSKARKDSEKKKRQQQNQNRYVEQRNSTGGNNTGERAVQWADTNQAPRRSASTPVGSSPQTELYFDSDESPATGLLEPNARPASSNTQLLTEIEDTPTPPRNSTPATGVDRPTMLLGLDEIEPVIVLLENIQNPVIRMEKELVDRLVIGRNKDADFHIIEESVSRPHCAIEREADGSCWIVNLSKTNSTKVNDGEASGIGSRLPIRDGDEITLGHVKLRFHLLQQR